MTLPIPRPGLVIRYAFLWSHEAEAGTDEAAKDRPCAIVVAARADATGSIRTIVAPITTRPPADAAASLEIPRNVCRSLGLGGERQWLRFDELNRFTWPGYDLRPVPGKRDVYDYGILPKDLFESLRHGILQLQQAKRVKATPRD